MSERQHHKKRYNQKLEFIAQFKKWISKEPNMFRILSWHKWKNERPKQLKDGTEQ